MRMHLSAAAFGVCAFAAAPAWADAIDGAWCKENGTRLVISGPSIITPGGRQMQGMYDRHGFTYVVPAGETGAGATIEMRLMGDYAMQSRVAGSASYEDWKRCGPAVS